MPNVAELLKWLDEHFPFSYAESFDNVGLLVGDYNAPFDSIALTFDITPEVVQKAVVLNTKVLISHHPIIFQGLKNITPYERNQKAIMTAIKHGINLIALHTNLDRARQGVNDILARRLGLVNVEPLEESDGIPGFIRIGELPQPMTVSDFLQWVCVRLNANVLRHNIPTKEKIKKVAVCGGSGSQFWRQVRLADVDAFVTADVKYHTFWDAQGSLFIIDAGHYETEVPVLQNLRTMLSETFNVPIHLIVSENPVKYFVYDNASNE